MNIHESQLNFDVNYRGTLGFDTLPFVTEILQKHQAPMESNHRFSHIETAMPSGIHPPFSDSPASATAGRFVAEPSNGPPPKSARGDMTRSRRSQEDAERIRWEPGTPVDPARARYPPEN